ncbi:21574_t:CDS:2 [Racocetra persica]|uniref:21574_t:CDS:1 n=1 Tax=Racocetra persica TaxID=160502 RepID=A0ACA9NCF1_9GLOM|nr:21574_t:CDS:2 [Racocetra persica]
MRNKSSKKSSNESNVGKDVIAPLAKYTFVKILESLPCDVDIEESKKAYGNVLKDIELYVNEMNKSNDNSDKKIIDYIKKMVKANKVRKMVTISNEKINDMAEVMLVQRGANIEIKDLIIDPKYLEDFGNIDERGKIQKMVSKGNQVAVKKMGYIILKEIAKQANIVALLS